MARNNTYVRGGGEAVYGLGIIGSVVYYIQNYTTLWNLILGLIKSVFWPAFVVYHLLAFFHI